MKFKNEDLITQIGLWGMFIGTFAFTAVNGISAFGVIATVGILLLAIDFPKKNKRNK